MDATTVISSRLALTRCMVVIPVITAFWTVLPAIVPNSAAFLGGGRLPIDRGHTWRGVRLLGDGTTIDGTLVGILVGTVTALLLNAVQPILSIGIGIMLPTFPLLVVVAMPTGAMLGDISASFLKRRAGYSRGAAVPVIDQVDALIGALIAAFLAAPAWAAATFTPPVLAVILLVVPLTRFLGNVVYHRAGLKDVPW